jgi:hypothetical protein
MSKGWETENWEEEKTETRGNNVGLLAFVLKDERGIRIEGCERRRRAGLWVGEETAGGCDAGITGAEDCLRDVQGRTNEVAGRLRGVAISRGRQAAPREPSEWGRSASSAESGRREREGMIRRVSGQSDVLR